MYVGQCRGAGFHGVADVPIEFLFTLSPQLRRDIWLTFGGHDGWILIVDHKEYYPDSADEAIDLVLSESARGAEEIEVTRYEGDCLHAMFDQKEMAHIEYRSSDGPICRSRNPAYTGPDDLTVGFPASNRNDYEVPAREVITTDHALKLIAEFIRTGTPGGLTPLA